jgi:prolyl-tRNA synthetase
LYDWLTQAGLEVLWDDRDERAGVKFNDADLIGTPFQLIIGDKGLAQGTVELKQRKSGAVSKLPPDKVLEEAQGLLRQSSS